MKLFDGRSHARELDKEIKMFVSSNKTSGKLAIILVGDNKASEKYIAIKQKVAKRLGIEVEVHKFDEKEVEKVLTRGQGIMSSPDVRSVIVQLPLPNEEFNDLIEKIPLEKDVDVLSSLAKGKFYGGGLSRFPPVIRGVEYFIGSNKLVLRGAKVLVVGHGELVGKPVAFYLEKQGASVEITENYKVGAKIDKNFVVLGAGVSNLVRGEDISADCNVIDFGISISNGKVVGDLDMESELDHLGVVSPSPGGMGPLVVRFLMMNHLGI